MKSVILSATLVAIVAISAAEIADEHGAYAALLMIGAVLVTFLTSVVRVLGPQRLRTEGKENSWK